MKRLVIICICAALAACGGGKKDGSNASKTTGNTPGGNVIDSVINAYMRLKDAFVSDKVENVNLAITGFVNNCALPDSNNLKNIPMKNTAMFLGICKELGATAQALSNAADMAGKRRLFKAMTEPMRKIVATHSSATVYEQHCPMAYNDSGANWLSFKHEIRNPFLPRTMLKCGLVQDTLKYVQ